MSMDVSGFELSAPMTHWGRENAAQFVRLVFSNEPVGRLRGLGERFRRALGP